MARGITEKQVFDAADELLHAGGRPTIERVRQVLGTGSPNTVNRYLDAWWRRLGERLKRGHSAIDGPPELERAYRQLWSLATGLAEQTESERIRTEKAALAEERAAVLRESEKLEPERQALKNARELLQAEMAELRTKAQEADQKLDQLRAESKAALQEAAASKRERDKLAGQLETAKERIDGNTRHFAEKIQNLQVGHEREVRHLKRNLEKSIQDQAKVETELERAREQVAELATELATARANASMHARTEKDLNHRLVQQGRRLDQLSASLRKLASKRSVRRRSPRAASAPTPQGSGSKSNP